ncbi:MAG: hypothetical protein QOF18_2636 [Frankiaceae bacterium]|nr:hypothetical protein [Frankiaceae bacterium]
MSPRVLHVAQPTTGGVAHYVAPLVADQVRRGWQTVVACPIDGSLGPDVRASGAVHEPWSARRSPGPSTAAEALALRRILRRHQPDVVHLHSSKAGLVGRLVLRGSRATVFQPHGWSWLAVSGATAAASLAWERHASRWCDRLLCVSAAERDVGRQAGVTAPWSVVHTGVDLRRFAPVSQAGRSAVRARLGRPDDEPLAVCVGRLSVAKGQDALAAAWPRVRSRVAAATLALVGDGELRPTVEAAAGEGVLLVGERSDVADWYAAADVVVVPSRWDALSLSLLEAAASGCCIVATDAPGAREVLGSGEGGNIVPLADDEALAQAVADRLLRPDQAGAEGAANRRRAEAQFDRGQAYDEMAALVLEVVARRGPAAPG